MLWDRATVSLGTPVGEPGRASFNGTCEWQMKKGSGNGASLHHHHHHHRHHNPLRVFAKSLPILLSLAVSLQFLIFRNFSPSISFSVHRCLGLPTGIVPMGLQSNSFLVGLARSILWTCPSHLIHCTLMNRTISAPAVSLSSSMLSRVLHIQSVLTGPNIFLSICLSKIIITIFINCNWVVTRWQWLFYM